MSLGLRSFDGEGDGRSSWGWDLRVLGGGFVCFCWRGGGGDVMKISADFFVVCILVALTGAVFYVQSGE